MSLQWITPPSQLQRNIEAYAQRLLTAVHAAAVYWGQMVQNDARRGAIWEDRTGNARGGLFFAVDGFGLQPITGTVTPGAMDARTDAEAISGDKDHLVIVLSHTVYYGVFLELCNGGAYAIIMSTVERNLPTLERLIREKLNDPR